MLHDPSERVALEAFQPGREYPVPTDGRVALDVPGYRGACSVYLFNKIRIRRGANPFTEKTIDVVVAGKLARRLSLEDVAALPTDTEGYHLLPLAVALP